MAQAAQLAPILCQDDDPATAHAARPAVAAADPDRAERIAQSITNDDRKADALATIAGAIALTDPNG